jgi:O-antigen ligase
MKQGIEKFITFLVSFILFSKFVGGSFHINIGALIILLVVLSLIEMFENKVQIDRHLNKYIFLILLFILLLLMSLLYSNAPNSGLNKIGILLLNVFIGLISAKHVVKHVKLFLTSNVFFLIIFFLYYFLFFGSFSFLAQNIDTFDRLELGNESAFTAIGASRYVGFGILNIICLFELYELKFKSKSLLISYFVKSIYYITIATACLIMVFLGSKGPIFSLIGVYFLYILFIKKIKIKIFIIILIIFFVTTNIEYILKYFDSSLGNYIYNRYFSPGVYQDRPNLINIALKNINPYSFLFGKGTGNYGYLYYKSDVDFYPHNIFIEVLYENGLIGLLLLLLLIVYPFFKNFRNKIDLIQISFSLFSYYFIINAQFSANIGNNSLFMIFLIYTITYSSLIDNTKKQNIIVESTKFRK